MIDAEKERIILVIKTCILLLYTIYMQKCIS